MIHILHQIQANDLNCVKMGLTVCLFTLAAANLIIFHLLTISQFTKYLVVGEEDWNPLRKQGKVFSFLKGYFFNYCFL